MKNWEATLGGWRTQSFMNSWSMQRQGPSRPESCSLGWLGVSSSRSSCANRPRPQKKRHKLLLPSVTATRKGIYGMTKGLGVYLFLFCASIKIIMAAERQCLFPGIEHCGIQSSFCFLGSILHYKYWLFHKFPVFLPFLSFS